MFDILVIGGGINGCGIARDAAGRGYSVLLAEMNDLASGASSGSTKLVHGGLRYLEHYKIHLVREALKEREILWSNAPHIISPLRFVLPHHAGMRPAWFLRLGLFVYDHIGGRHLLPPTRTLDLSSDVAGKPLKPAYVKAFEYSDCRVDDARLVVLNARDAAARGAVIRTRTEVTGLRFGSGNWEATLRDTTRGEISRVAARLVVNAAGPWVDQVLSRIAGRRDATNVRLIKGSHVVVPRLFDHDRSYVFQNSDRRIVFAIPFESDYTLIGTTDEDFDGDPGSVSISSDEAAYLCSAVSEYLVRAVKPSDVIWSYSAVRPLHGDDTAKAQDVTRDYVVKHEGTTEGGALINVFGGKITTYRRLAEATLKAVGDLLGRRGGSWTKRAPLPGGDFPAGTFDDLVRDLSAVFPFLTPAHARRLARLYGTAVREVLAGARSQTDLGRCFGADLHEAEVRYLIDSEWARTAEDVLWRRTKCGLQFTRAEVEALEAFMAAHPIGNDAATERVMPEGETR